MSRCVAIAGRGWMRFRLVLAVACPNISKPRFVENSIGSNCFSFRSKAVEAERDAGLAPTPWQSGAINREQGILQSANPTTNKYSISRARRSPSGSIGYNQLTVAHPAALVALAGGDR
jgi:hypothetical protein